jgi:hypothetical protein
LKLDPDNLIGGIQRPIPGCPACINPIPDLIYDLTQPFCTIRKDRESDDIKAIEKSSTEYRRTTLLLMIINDQLRGIPGVFKCVAHGLCAVTACIIIDQ